MRLVWTLVLAVVLAGCADEAPQAEDDDLGALDEDLEATSTTGVIRGVVVDAAVVPVEGATIKLRGTDKSATTNADGAFGFDKLEPGTYFLQVSALGYESVQQSTDVEAGVDRPPVVRVMLQHDMSFTPPRYELLTYEGFYQCGTSVVVICAAPNILLGSGTTDDSSTPTIYFPGGERMIQSEMVWESTQAISPELYFEMEALDSGCDGSRSFLGSASGESPIRTRVSNETLKEGDIGGEDCGIYYSVFAGGAQGTPVGFSIEQDFTWFITSFYGYEPAEDWWFVEHGPSPPPS